MCWYIHRLCLVLCLLALLVMQQAFTAIVQDGARSEECQRCWGSVDGAVYTLLATIASGLYWVDCVVPLDNYSLGYRAIFLCCIVLVTFGMLSMLTRNVVARASERSALDKYISK